jgi:hypothetical protein
MFKEFSADIRGSGVLDKLSDCSGLKAYGAVFGSGDGASTVEIA